MAEFVTSFASAYFPVILPFPIACGSKVLGELEIPLPSQANTGAKIKGRLLLSEGEARLRDDG